MNTTRKDTMKIEDRRFLRLSVPCTIEELDSIDRRVIETKSPTRADYIRTLIANDAKNENAI